VTRVNCRGAALLATLLLLALGSAAGCASKNRVARIAPPSAPISSVTPSVAPTPSETVPAAAPATGDLPVINYGRAPRGFPADPAPMSTTALTEGLHPTRKVAVYDAPDGRPLAYLTPTLAGLQLVMPVVARKSGWVSVVLPSANRTLGWLPAGGWTITPLRDQLVVALASHTLTWYREGRRMQSWTVATGTSRTPTPLGRTFILGRSAAPSSVYAGVDVFVLGAVPDDPSTLSAGLRGAHTGLHAWYSSSVFGKSVSNGCIRMPRSGQQTLLAELTSGTELVVVKT
jgi:lipoprotein-anchoring transpeptidase ErfK/SrfK